MPSLPDPGLLGAHAAVLERHPEHVTVSSAALEALARSLTPELVDLPPRCLPVSYDDLEDELSYLMLLCALDVGSGFTPLLMDRVQRSARETVLYGLMSLRISGSVRLDRAFLSAFRAHHVTAHFGVDSHEEAPVGGSLAGLVTMSRPGALSGFCHLLARVVNELGEGLEAAGEDSLGGWLLATVRAQTAGGRAPSAIALVEELSDTFPCFRDTALVDGVDVPYMRKASALVHTLHVRFGDEEPLLRFMDILQLVGDSGPVTVAVLARLGVLRPSAELAQVMELDGDLPPGTAERCLRSGAVIALQALARACDWPEASPVSLGEYVQHRACEPGDLQGIPTYRLRTSTAY